MSKPRISRAVSKAPSPPCKVSKSLRINSAMDLRAAGASWTQIADQLKISERAACDLVKHALKDLTRQNVELAEQGRQMMTHRLNALMRIHYTDARDRTVEPTVRQRAAEICIKLEIRRAQLWGLDAPTQIRAELKHTDERDIDRELRAQFDKVVRAREVPPIVVDAGEAAPGSTNGKLANLPDAGRPLLGKDKGGS